MKSIKKLVVSISSVVLVSVLLSYFVNFVYTQRITPNMHKNLSIGIKIHDTHIELDTPLRLLNNILEQMNTFDELDPVRQNGILEAYHRNYTNLLSKVEENQREIEAQEAMLEQLKDNLLFNVFVSYIEMDSLNNELRRKYDELQEGVSLISLTQRKESAERVKELEKIHTEIKQLTTRGIQLGMQLEGELRNTYTTVIGAILLLLVSLTLVLVILITRIIRLNIQYIMSVFKRISDHGYKNQITVVDFNPIFREEINLKNFVQYIYDEQRFLEEIKSIASEEYILDDLLEKIFYRIQNVLQVDRLGVAFVDYDRKRIIAETGKIDYGNVLLGPGFEVDFKDTSLTKILVTKKSKIINNLLDELNKKPFSPSLKLITREGIRSNMIIPLITGDVVFGFIFFSSFNTNSYDEKTLRIAENIAYMISAIIDKTYLTKSMLHNITLTFADLVEKKDLETGNHINRMTNYSKIIAEALIDNPKKGYEINQRFLHDIELYAPLHDIGKVGIPDKVLDKPGKLTEEEWEVMKQHTTIGADILKKLKENLKIFKKQFFDVALDVAEFHHEKWDGSGYPKGLRGDEIPLAARIVAIADVFDALSSRRPYKEPFSFEKSVRIIQEGSGSHFDPTLVEVFMQNLPKIKEIYELDFLDELEKELA